MVEIRKAVIIGAGPAGLVTALRLKQNNNITPIIYEYRAGPVKYGGALGIPSNGMRLFDRLGLYQQVTARGAETSHIVVHSLQGSALGSMDLATWSKDKTGFGYVRIKRGDLMEVLLEAAEAANIEIHYGKRITSIEEKGDQVTARFEDGTDDTGDILIGCDGIHSKVRGLYVDPECTPEYTGIANMFSILPTSVLEVPNPKFDNLNATMTSDGLFAITPTTPSRDQVYWFFSRQVAIPAARDARDGWEERGKQEVESVKTLLHGLLGSSQSDWTRLLHDAVQKAESIQFYPIYRVPVGRPWSRGRCVVAGDAAHAMPPHASQGVSMALEDAFLLSNLLRRGHLPLAELLRVFEERRKVRTEEMLRTAQRNGTVREKKGQLGLWVSEVAAKGALWIYDAANLQKLGLGQKPLVYDVEEETF